MEWILVLIVQTGSSSSTLKYVSDKMTIEQCEKAAKTFKPAVPSGGDAEVSLAVVCSKNKLEYKQ